MLCNNYNFILVFCIFACSPLLCHEGWSAGTRWGNIECGSCHMRVKSYFVSDTRIADHLIGDVNYKNQHAVISTTSSSEPMNDTSAPMTISQRLLYEILATIVEQYINAPLPIHISVRKHLPKFIRKQYPGMSRRKWKKMCLSFAKNHHLRDIFYRYRRKIRISTFLGMVYDALKVTVTFWVSYSILLARYYFIVSYLVVRFWVLHSIILTRYHFALFLFRLLWWGRCICARLHLVLTCLCYPLTIHSYERRAHVSVYSILCRSSAPCTWMSQALRSCESIRVDGNDQSTGQDQLFREESGRVCEIRCWCM
jgi:hypothetical protein